MKSNEKILLAGGGIGVLLLLLMATKKKSSSSSSGTNGSTQGYINADQICPSGYVLKDGVCIKPKRVGRPDEIPDPNKPKTGKGLELSDLGFDELPPPPKPDVPEEEPVPEDIPQPKILDYPTPGNYYAIKYGDTLLGTAGKAYNYDSGADRLNAARQINLAKYNKRFWHFSGDNLFPPSKVRISFNPHYPLEAIKQYDDPVNGGLNEGTSYAIIWIPERKDWVIDEAAKARL